MRRPLACICLCLVMLAALRLHRMEQESAKWQEQLLLADSHILTVTGRVYDKKENQIYIESIRIHESSANPQNEFPDQINFICECTYGEELSLGNTVEVQGEYRCFRVATNPGEFDAYAYYWNLGVCGKLYNARIVSVDENCWCVRELLYDLRCFWESKLYALFPEKEASILCTMLLGDKEELDGEVKELFQQNGIAHILSISGLHITIIGMGIYQILRKAGIGRKTAAVVGCGILILYGIMTGMSVSTCRAVGMYLIRMVGESIGRTYDGLTSVAVIGAVMTCVHPQYLANCGFLLSYGAILGINVFSPLLTPEEEDTRSLQRQQKGAVRVLTEWVNGLRAGLTASLSVTLATLPIQLWYFYEVPMYSILLNLLVVPLMSAVMVGGLLTLLLPLGGGITAYLPYAILKWYESICAIFDTFPFHTWNPGRPKAWQVVVYYGILLAMVAWKQIGAVVQKRMKECAGLRREAKSQNEKQEIQHGRRWKCLRKILLLGMLTTAVIVLGMPIRQGDILTILDVGQGDGICLELESGEVYLFDCGSTSRGSVGEYVLLPFLKYNGISHIDAVFLSHPDEDHCNGILELLTLAKEERVTIDRIVLPAIAETNRQEAFGEIWKAVEETACTSRGGQSVRVQYIGAGDTWEVGNLRLTCLHPQKGTAEVDSNVYSECFYVESAGGFSVLLTGDVEENGEEELVAELQRRNLTQVTLLKVGHHGSRYATSEALLEQIHPQVAVISCGENNSYGHPHKEVLERLKEAECTILATPECGAIRVEITLFAWEVRKLKRG